MAPVNTPAGAQRLHELADGSVARTWTIRDDNSQHYHGVVRLQESPLLLRLLWKASADAPQQEVGVYRLELDSLLAGGYIRREGASDEVRLRFMRGDDDLIYIETKSGAPRLPLPHVRR
jgi:hypothetical protein